MKHKRFRLLLIAMSFALAGLVCLQAYWLTRAVALEKKKFTEQVQEAMTKATAKLETGEAFSMITEEMIPDPTITPDIVQDCVVVVSDSGKTVRIHGKRLSPLASLPSIPELKSLPPLPPLPPTSFNAPEPPPTIIINDSVVVNNDTNRLVVMARKERMKDAVKGVWMQYVFKSGDAQERLSGNQINDALNESFKNSGIDAPFDFAVLNRRDSSLELISDPQKKELFRSATFRTALFPSDIRPKGEELVVLIDSHHNKIIQALWPQFLVSLIFTLFLILVFAMTFREALKQKKLSEIRNDFINNMTHEFKTPIATISLAADTVVNEAVIHDPERIRQYAEVIKRENKRMNDQVEKVLELALTERNELRMEIERVDLNELLSRLITVMSLQLQAKGGMITTDLSKLPVVVDGDAFHLERVFLNLLDNAIKYSAAAPELLVKTIFAEDELQVEISDNGIGISTDDQKRIFDRFYRVSTGNLHDVKGFGLGLSYVKTIVEKHGGKIEVESKPGKGSTFRIRFKR